MSWQKQMMKILISTFNKFHQFQDSCNIKILEKSELLKTIQKKKIKDKKVKWLDDLNSLNNFPCIFIANEFFDALPIKQFIKKKNNWHERYVKFINQKKLEFFDFPFNIQKLEKKIKFKIGKRPIAVEYSPLASVII